MQYFKIGTDSFHDSVINNISYIENRITLYFSESKYENTYGNVKIEIPGSSYSFETFYVRQYPFFRRIKLKGKEISFEKLKSWFKNGRSLCIVETFVSKDGNLLVFECDVFPYSSRRGVNNKVIFKFNYDKDYIVLKKLDED